MPTVEIIEHAPAPELATAWLQDAIDEAAGRGGGQVRVPAGTHRTGALRLRSGIDLHLEAGAVLQFVPEPELYPAVEARWEGAVGTVHSPCLYAHGATDVAITGFGTLDGGGAAWWDTFLHRRGELAHPRPTLIGLHECERVTIRDVALRNSPAWTVHPALCDDVTITNVRISNPADSPNTDGIDPESCRNVRISDCHIDVGDDCIAIKAGTERTPSRVASENIVITGCTMVRGHGGVVIGSEMSGGVRNVVISNLRLPGHRSRDPGEDPPGPRRDRRGRAGDEHRHGRRAVPDHRGNPFSTSAGPTGRTPMSGTAPTPPVDAGTPQIRGLHLAHLTARNVHASAGHLYGLPEAPLADLSIHDLTVSFAAEPRAASPEMASGVEPRTRSGIELGFVRREAQPRTGLRGRRRGRHRDRLRGPRARREGE